MMQPVNNQSEAKPAAKIEQRDKDFIEPKDGCCTKAWKVMGFDTVNKEDNTILDVQRSFNRCFVSKVSEPVMPAINVLAFFLVFFTLISSLRMFASACLYGRGATAHSIALGPSCHLDWILFGPNQVSLCWLLFVIVAGMNNCFYPTTKQFDRVPFSMKLQWVLYITCVSFTFLSFIVLFTEWGGYTQPEYLQQNQKVNLSFAVIYTIVGFYETRFRHVLWVTFVYMCHIGLILLVDATTGIFADHPTLDLTADVFFSGAFAFYGFLLLIMLVLVGVHKLKLRYFAAGTLMKSSIVSQLVPGDDPDDEEESEELTSKASQQLSQV